MPAISVIVPVYNVEDYLALCLSSIRKQSFTDIEIICVNDGSTDSSAEILAMVAGVEPRLRIIDKPNGGLSSARNAGLAEATGDIVMFVDSDDWIDHRACAWVKEVFDEHQPDLATFAARIFPRSAVNPWLMRVLDPEPEVLVGQHIELPFIKGASPFVWRTAARRAFLQANNISFDENVGFGEDQIFHFEAYPQSTKTVLSDKRIYFYRSSRPGSLMAERDEDHGVKLAEHQIIARHILHTWRNQGWLESHEQMMADWVAEFLIVDTLMHPVPIRLKLHDGLVELLTDFFGDALNLSAPTRRLFASVTNSTKDMNLCYPALVGYTLAQRGFLRGTTALSLKVASSILGPVKDLARRLLPPPAHNIQRYIESVIDLNEDASARLIQQQLLYAQNRAKIAQ